MDGDGRYWVQPDCAPRGPKEGDPDRPASPAPITLDASFYGLFK